MKTITDLKDFCPKSTIVIDGDATFKDFPEITDLGNLQEIRGTAYFGNSKVQDLGNLQTIGGSAFFGFCQIKDLGNLQTIGGSAFFNAYFGKRTDLQAEWEAKQNNK